MASFILILNFCLQFSPTYESYIFENLVLTSTARQAFNFAGFFGAILLLFNKTAWMGALICFCMMMVPIKSYANVFNFELPTHNLHLFAICLFMAACSGIVLYFRRIQIPYFGYMLF